MSGPQIHGRWVLVRELAVGGMAQLFVAKAADAGSHTADVVLKRMLPQLAARADYVKMFVAEAQLTMALAHPSVVQIYDIDKAKSGEMFYVMEFVDGASLDQILQHGTSPVRLQLDVAALVALDLADVLDHIHTATDDDGDVLGVVHRDLCPANVLVGRGGQIKLCDFGVAAVGGAGGGEVKGRIQYMSPEQARGEPVDPRSDVYSLGVMFFEMLTGTRMYGTTNRLQIVAQLIDGVRHRARDRWPDCPDWADELIARATAPSADHRFESARDFADEVRAWVGDLAPRAALAKLVV